MEKDVVIGYLIDQLREVCEDKGRTTSLYENLTAEFEGLSLENESLRTEVEALRKQAADSKPSVERIERVVRLLLNPDQKIEGIKELRALTGCSLKSAYDISMLFQSDRYILFENDAGVWALPASDARLLDAYREGDIGLPASAVSIEEGTTGRFTFV